MLEPHEKVLKDQIENALSPFRKPYYSMHCACAMVKTLHKNIRAETKSLEKIHPFLTALAIRFGPTHEVIKKILLEVNPHDLSTDNSLKIISTFQTWAFELNMTQKEITYLDYYQQVYSETVQNNLNML